MIGAPTLERSELLQAGARVLQSRLPIWQAHFRLHAVAYRARFEWPGVVSVADDNTGEVLARSVPGQPATPDAQTLALAPLRRYK